MRKLFQKIMLVVALLAFTLPAMAATNIGKKHSASLMGASAITATFGMVASIKKTDGTEFSTDEKELLNAVQKLVAENQTGTLTKEQLVEELKNLNISEESIKQIKDEIVKLDSKVEASLESKTNKEVESVLKQFREKLMAPGMAEKLKALYTDKAGHEGINMVIKAPITMTMTTAEYDRSEEPGVNAAPAEENRVFDYVRIINDGQPGSSVAYLEAYGTEGNAAVTAAGALKPLRSNLFRKVTANPFKVAVHEKCPDDYLLYVDGLLDFLKSDILKAIEDARDAKMVDLIDTAANLYNLTTISTTNANNYDAIRAAIAQIRSLNYKPTHVFLHPIDAANFEISKGSDGHYMFIGTANPEGVINISKLMVIETTSIPQGSFTVADMSKVNVKVLSEIMIRMAYGVTVSGGTTTDDLTRDILTIIGEQYLTAYIKQLDGNAFVYDTFANVIAAL